MDSPKLMVSNYIYLDLILGTKIFKVLDSQIFKSSNFVLFAKIN